MSLSRLSRTSVYEHVTQGEIRHLRVGRKGKKILIPECGIADWINQIESGVKRIKLIRRYNYIMERKSAHLIQAGFQGVRFSNCMCPRKTHRRSDNEKSTQ